MAVLSTTHVPSRAAILGFPAFENHPRRVREHWLEIHRDGKPQVQELIAAFRGLAEVVPEMASILPAVVTQYLGTEPLEGPAGR